METGKVELDEIRRILDKNKSVMLKSNIIGSDFSFMRNRSADLVFKIEPMVFYDLLSVRDNALLSVLFPLNDFVTSGTWPAVAMIDFEKPNEAGKEFSEYIEHVFRHLEKRRIKVASGHTGRYGNLGYGVAGTMALIGFEKPVFSFRRIEKGDSVYSIGEIGAELSYYRGVRKQKMEYKAEDLSIEKTVKELLKSERAVHYVHDLSEGGLMRGLKEMTQLFNSGFDVESEKLEEVAAKGVEEYGARIFSASSSGSVIVSVDSGRTKEFEKRMNAASLSYFGIGRRKKGVTLDGKRYNSKDSVLDFLP